MVVAAAGLTAESASTMNAMAGSNRQSNALMFHSPISDPEL
jgi:hypothetical protein